MNQSIDTTPEKRRRGRPRKYQNDAERKRLEYSRQTSEKKRIKIVKTQERRKAKMDDPEEAEEYRNRNAKRMRSARSSSSAKFKAAIVDVNFEFPGVHDLGDMDVRCCRCGALFFKVEMKKTTNIFNQCCNFGNVCVPIPKYPEKLRKLIEGDANESQEFRENIRNYNCAFAMAALSADIDTPRGGGPFCYRIHGQIYHKIPPPQPGEKAPKYAQLYFLDSKEAHECRLNHPANKSCSPTTMALIEQQLTNINPFIKSFKKMANVMNEEEQKALQEGRTLPKIQLVFDTNNRLDKRRYNKPTADEIAGVYVINEDETPPPRQYVAIEYPGGKIVYLSDIDPKCDPMCYPILRPYGELGWDKDLEKVSIDEGRRRTKVTQLEYYMFLLAIRNDFNILHHAGKLFQQFIVDVFIRIEQYRLTYHKTHQTELRAEKYRVLVDYLTGDDNSRIGRKIILPSTFPGSPRYMLALYQDSMAMVARFGKPDLFITFTCNANWPEIMKNLRPHQVPSDRPDLVARVFHEKLISLLDDVIKNGIFGAIKAYLWVIEYQKRGLPHAHMLFCLEEKDKLKTPEAVDQIIWARIPDAKDEQLFSVVTKYNLHNRCGTAKPEAPCMDIQTGICSKRFPKAFQEITIMDKDGFPEYKRPMNGPRYTTPSGETVDSRWVVPYNPYLSVKYDGHINVELCSTISAIKYVHKYVYKGPDRARLILKSRDDPSVINYDEIEAFKDMRYICAPEAVSRIFEYDLHGRSHSVVRLTVHLPEQQDIYYTEGLEKEAVERGSNTTLTSWFSLNRNDLEANQYLYCQIPEHYRWDKKTWVRRKKHEKVIGRMNTVSPREGERFYLRVMLLYTPGAKSFADLRTVGGTIYGSFKTAATAAGYLEDDKEYENCLQDAVQVAMPIQLRALFAFIISMCDVHNAESLWEMFKGNMIDDYLHRGINPECAFALAYAEIKEIAAGCGKNLNEIIQRPGCEVLEIDNEFIDVDKYKRDGHRMYLSLNSQQKAAADAILDKHKQCIFIDGPGGSGKTYLYQTLNNILIGNGKRVLNVAWSGIAATLLPNGRTVHTAFKLPVPINDTRKLSLMKVQSIEARKLKEIDIIIWDEAPMAPKQALEAVDILLRDIMQQDQPFGGKQIVLGGDFRQIPPVVPHGSRMEIVRASIKYSELWNLFHHYSLTDNMRTQQAGPDWNDFLLKIGNGTIGNSDGILRIPDDLLSTGDVIEDIFGDIKNIEDVESLIDRVILAPKNFDSLEMNNKVLSKIPGEEHIYTSIDEAVCDEAVDETHFPLELLNTLTPQSYPPHALHLKKGAIVMLLRNLRINRGLCNGTRLIVEGMSRYYLSCKVITGSGKGDHVLIPRVTFLPNNDDPSPFKLKRRQFPLRLAFAMTINKSQGQTFNRVGFYLPTPIFSHGQLYVAFSRVRSRNQLKILLSSKEKTANNVVFKEMLL